MKSDRKASRFEKKVNKKENKKSEEKKHVQKRGKKAGDSKDGKSKKQKPVTQAHDEDEQQKKKARKATAKKASQDAPLDRVHEHGINDKNDVGDSTVPSGPPSQSPIKVRNRGLKKLRKLAGVKLCHVYGESEEDGPKEGDETQKGLGGGEHDPDGDGETQVKPKPKAKCVKTKSQGQKQKQDRPTKDKTTKDAKAPKKRGSAKTCKQQQSHETGRQTTSRRNSRSSKQPIVTDDGVKSLIKSTLEECRDTCCVHPNFQWAKVDPTVCQFTTYWSRKHAGIKLCRSYVPWKKGNGKAKQVQVAYFGCETSCTYSNLALAGLYVTCMHFQKYISLMPEVTQNGLEDHSIKQESI